MSQTSFQAAIQNSSVAVIVEHLEMYREFLCKDNGDLSSFWMTYIELVEILLGVSSREGNWFLHLWSIKAMIPWYFAYDHLNYARYLPVYYEQMTNLQTSHPDVFQHFLNGGFAVQPGAKTHLEEYLLTKQSRKPSTKTHRLQVTSKDSV